VIAQVAEVFDRLNTSHVLLGSRVPIGKLDAMVVIAHFEYLDVDLDWDCLFGFLTLSWQGGLVFESER